MGARPLHRLDGRGRHLLGRLQIERQHVLQAIAGARQPFGQVAVGELGRVADQERAPVGKQLSRPRPAHQRAKADPLTEDGGESDHHEADERTAREDVPDFQQVSRDRQHREREHPGGHDVGEVGPLRKQRLRPIRAERMHAHQIEHAEQAADTEIIAVVGDDRMRDQVVGNAARHRRRQDDDELDGGCDEAGRYIREWKRCSRR